MTLQEQFAIFRKARIYTSSLTIDHAQVPSTQSNFPVLVNFTDARFKTIANGGHVKRNDGFDIGFFSDSAGTTPLKWEMERYSGATGEIIAHVKNVSISNSSDTIFYTKYGDPTITTDQSDPANVWTNSFIKVFHLKDGATLDINSPVGLNTGNVNHGATAIGGNIDGGANFVNASSQYIDEGIGSVATHTSVTLSAWVNASSFPNAYNAVVALSDSGFTAFQRIFVRSNGKLRCNVRAGSSLIDYDGTGSHTLVTGQWYYLTLTYSSSTGLIGYVNGASDNTVSPNASLNIASVNLYIGDDNHLEPGTHNFWDGIIDELRIANVARSADWVTCEYNNQKPSSTFVSLGTEI
jgi:hypothetical protein